MPSRSDAVEKHIPAWKKLGLKLKYANEEPTSELDLKSAEISHVDIPNGKRRKSLPDKTSIPPANPTKRVKTSASVKSSVSTNNNNTTPPQLLDSTSTPLLGSTSPRLLGSTSSTASIPQTNPTIKRKTVSFTPETKTKDGDSTKQLFTTWLNSHLSIDPSFDPSSAPDALQFITPTSIATPNSPTPSNPKKHKKSKKPKSQKTIRTTPTEPTSSTSSSSIETSSTSPRTPILLYLHTYHTTPNAWKFSKTRQTQVLRQVFSLTAIPDPYEPALRSYLRGLNDGAAAKQRLRMAALSVRTEDDEWLKGLEPDDEDQRRRRLEYDNALERLKTALREGSEEGAGNWTIEDEEWRAHYLKRKRAEAILWTLGSPPAPAVPPPPSSIAPASAPTTTTTTKKTPTPPRPKKRRRRKQRTGVPDDDDDSTSSSSSSSSSSSDSNSDDEDEGGDARRGKGREKLVVRGEMGNGLNGLKGRDGDSSSSSSGSPSESESESSSADTDTDDDDDK